MMKMVTSAALQLLCANLKWVDQRKWKDKQKDSFRWYPLIPDCWEDRPHIISSVGQGPKGAGKQRAESALEEGRAELLMATGIANSGHSC